MFRDQELLFILRHDGKMNGSHIMINTGMPVRTQTHELTKHYPKKPTVHHPRLKEHVWGKVKFPWGLDADNTVEEINALIFDQRYADLQKRYGFFVNLTVEKFDSITCNGRHVTEEEFGLVLVHYAYFAGAHSSKTSRLATPEAALRFEKSQALAIKIFEPYDYAWARLIKARLIVNNITDSWNNTPRGNRNSADMHTIVKNSFYIETLVKYNDIVSNDYRAPFSALAVSSRFCWRQHYDDLYQRLKKAAPEYNSLKTIKNKSFDDDFDDFLEWVKITYPDTLVA